MQFAEKLWGILENIETLNLQQQKKKKLFSIRTKLSHHKVFHRKFISSKNEKNQITINNPVYLRLSTLNLSKTVMYEF